MDTGRSEVRENRRTKARIEQPFETFRAKRRRYPSPLPTCPRQGVSQLERGFAGRGGFAAGEAGIRPAGLPDRRNPQVFADFLRQLIGDFSVTRMVDVLFVCGFQYTLCRPPSRRNLQPICSRCRINARLFMGHTVKGSRMISCPSICSCSNSRLTSMIN